MFKRSKYKGANKNLFYSYNIVSKLEHRESTLLQSDNISLVSCKNVITLKHWGEEWHIIVVVPILTHDTRVFQLDNTTYGCQQYISNESYHHAMNVDNMKDTSRHCYISRYKQTLLLNVLCYISNKKAK